MSRRLVVVTGGPGSGKSALVAALAGRGLATVPESGRAVIKAEIASGGSALPWTDRGAFAERMLATDVAAYADATQEAGPVVFDRGIPDTIGYLRLCALPIPAGAWEAARNCRYDRRVLIAPPWRAIFVNDAERKQSFVEAEATCAVMRETYAELGYETIDLPLATVEARVAFVRALLAQDEGVTGSAPY